MCKFSHCNMSSSLAESKSLTAISLCPLQCISFQSINSNKLIQTHLYILYILNIYILKVLYTMKVEITNYLQCFYISNLWTSLFTLEKNVFHYCMICICSYTNFYFIICILNCLSSTKNCLHFKLLFYT